MGFLKDTVLDYFDDAAGVADLKMSQLKLKATDELVTTSARIASFLLILAVAVVLLALLAVVAVLFLAKAIGDAAYASLIVLGAFAILFIILITLRKKMFLNLFSRFFSDMRSYSRLKDRLADTERKISDRERYTKHSTIRLILNILDKF